MDTTSTETHGRYQLVTYHGCTCYYVLLDGHIVAMDTTRRWCLAYIRRHNNGQ